MSVIFCNKYSMKKSVVKLIGWLAQGEVSLGSSLSIFCYVSVWQNRHYQNDERIRNIKRICYEQKNVMNKQKLSTPESQARWGFRLLNVGHPSYVNSGLSTFSIVGYPRPNHLHLSVRYQPRVSDADITVVNNLLVI